MTPTYFHSHPLQLTRTERQNILSISLNCVFHRIPFYFSSSFIISQCLVEVDAIRSKFAIETIKLNEFSELTSTYFSCLAVGCILPPTPSRVILDYRVENSAKFFCQPNHVFPDSSHPERILRCENEVWNDTLVNCVGEFWCDWLPLSLDSKTYWLLKYRARSSTRQRSSWFVV